MEISFNQRFKRVRYNQVILDGNIAAEDLYLNIDGRNLQVCKKNKKISENILKKIKDSSIEYNYLYVNNYAFKNILMSNVKKINDFNEEGISLSAKAIDYVSEIFDDRGIKDETIKLGKELLFPVISKVLNQKKYRDILKSIEDKRKRKCSISTAIFSLILCTKMENKSRIALNDLFVSSILIYHFQGKEGLNKSLINKSSLSNKIKQIILHSEENMDGSGPNRLRSYQIDPLAKILKISYTYSDILYGYYFEDRDIQMDMTPNEAYFELSLNQKLFDRKILEQLANLI